MSVVPKSASSTNSFFIFFSRIEFARNLRNFVMAIWPFFSWMARTIIGYLPADAHFLACQFHVKSMPTGKRQLLQQKHAYALARHAQLHRLSRQLSLPWAKNYHRVCSFLPRSVLQRHRNFP